MFQAHLAKSVLLDTSPFRRFTEAELLAELMSYLPAASVVAEVGSELDDAARSERYKALAGAMNRFNWTKRIAGISGPMQLADAKILLDILRQSDPGKSHVGEVATILRAKQLGVQLVIMDDRDARKKVAGPRGVKTIATATLASEMTYRGALSEEQGWCVFQLAAKGTVFTDFEGALERAAQPATPF